MNKFLFVNSDGYNEEGYVSGNVALRECDTTLSVGDLVTESITIPNGVDKVTDNKSVRSVIGWVYAKPTTTTAEILLKGEIIGLSGLNKAAKVYLSGLGTFTSDIPLSGYLHVLGHAIEADILNFDPSNTKVKRDLDGQPTPIQNTLILVQSDTTDGDVGVVDSTGLHTFTGNLAHSTDTAKFGATSIKSDGTNYAQAVASDLAIGTRDFTLDCWINRLAEGTTYGGIVGCVGSNTNGAAVFTSVNLLSFFIGTQAGNTCGTVVINTAPVDVWDHYAVTRKDNITYKFINGVLLETCSEITNYDNDKFKIMSRYDDGSYIQTAGFYVDEIRFCVDYAEWTTDFIPPTKPYVLV